MNFTTKPADVRSLSALRELKRLELLALLHLGPADVHEDVAYQKLSGVARINNDAAHPGHFYARGENVELVYIRQCDFLRRLTPESIRKELGHDGVRLRSRVGKRSNQYVFPEKGFAFSETDGVLDFVELFAPMPLTHYREHIYEDVGEFLK